MQLAGLRPSHDRNAFNDGNDCFASCTEGGPSHCDSAADPKCSSCTAGVATYCQQCCPKNYTEQYFADNP